MTETTPRQRKRPLLTEEELRVWRNFTKTAEALRSELTSRLQSESSPRRATMRCYSP